MKVVSKEVDFASILDQYLIVVPTVNLNGDNTIASIDIALKDIQNQDATSSDFIQNLSINIQDTDNFTIYETFDLSGNTTNIVPSSGINWSDVQGISFDYFTDLGNNYHTFYDKNVSTSQPDIFGGTDIPGFPGWKSSPWYLNYNVDFWPWIFHDEHEWQFVFDGSTVDVIFIFDLGLANWIFLNQNTYRWIFIFGGENAGWVFTFGDNRPGRRFFQRLDNGNLFSVPPDLPTN